MNLLKKLNKKTFFIILFLIILSLPSVFFLFKAGFFQTDDGEWMVVRFSAFHQALRDGQFPVRFLARLNYGYGYPVANFLYPGFMYLGEPLKVLGFGFVDTVKIILGLSLISSLIFTFLWLRKVFDDFSAFIGSLFYLYTPYHLFDLYKRGSVGEVLALAIVPFIFWQIERKSLFLTTIGIAFLIITHNTLAILFLPIILLYMLLDIFILKGRKLLIYKYTSILVLGFGLSAFFWIPAFFELKYTNFGNTKVSNYAQYFTDQKLIGISTLLVFILFFILSSTKKIKLSKHRLTLLFFIVGLISLFFSMEISLPLWKFLPASFIQFPFRLLSVVLICMSFLVASMLSVFSHKTKIGLAILFLIFLYISSLPFIYPSQFFNKGEGFYSTNEGTTTVQDEYMPKWVKQKPTEHFREKVEIVDGEVQINNLIYNSNKIEFNTISKTGSRVKINTIYYPGWKAFVNSKESSVQYRNEQGVMELNLPKGESSVKLLFTETPLRLFSDILSLLSLFLLGFIKIKFPKFGI